MEYWDDCTVSRDGYLRMCRDIFASPGRWLGWKNEGRNQSGLSSCLVLGSRIALRGSKVESLSLRRDRSFTLLMEAIADELLQPQEG